MNNYDIATLLTLQYLAAIENNLKITWNDQGQPICVMDWFGTESIQLLRKDLNGLLNGKLGVEARQATVEYGKEHIQTVGFGHASDFDKFVKLGFIYGERVVLWDVILSRLLVEDTVTPRLKTLLAQTACNLLLLRPVVENGGLVVLPHPICWSNLAAEADAEMRSQGNKSAADLGLTMALAAIEEGMSLHPYTLLINGTPPTAQAEVANKERELYSPENYIFHTAVTSMLGNKRFAFLQGATAADFHDIVTKHPELQRELRKHFTTALMGLSPQQVKAELDHLNEDLIKLIDKRNKAVFDYVAEAGEASATYAITAITAFIAGLAAIDALTTGGLSVALSTAIRKWANRPDKNVIVQAFQEFKEQTDVRATSRVFPDDEKKNIYESIEGMYLKFMSFDWTESRHYFLESLSPEVARELLKMLGPDDLEQIVNYRRFQEAYIGDYISYLWEIDKNSFWEHIGKTFESPEGILLYDDDAHIQIMCSHDMPQSVWLKLLNSLLILSAKLPEKSYISYQLEVMSDIFRYQMEESIDFKGKRDVFIDMYKSLATPEKEQILSFLESTYKYDLPTWLTVAGSEE